MNKFFILINKLILLISKEKFQKRLSIFNLTISCFCIIFIVNLINNYRSENNIQIELSFLEMFLIIGSYLLAATIWSNYMRSNNRNKGRFNFYFYNWCYSQLGKYVASGVASISIRLNQKKAEQQDPKKTIYGMIEEQFLIPILTIPTLIVCLYFDLDNYVFLAFGFFLILFYFIFVKFYSKMKPNLISLVDQPVLLLLYIYLQLVIFFVISKNLGYSDPVIVSLLYYLSANLGLFFVGVPAGIGIREMIFLTVTNNIIGNYDLIEFIVKTRFLFILLDLLFGIFGLVNIYRIKNDEK